MEHEDILRAALAVGLTFELPPTKLIQFAQIIAEHEREACAKTCDNLSIDRGMFHPDDEMFKEGILGGARMCAATIRLRSRIE